MSNANFLKKWFGHREQPKAEETQHEEEFYRAGQWQLVWWKFRRHKLAQMAMVVLGILYFIAIFAEFVSPHDPLRRYRQYLSYPPTAIHIRDSQGNFRAPFIYGMKMGRDPVTVRPVYEENTGIIYPIGLFVLWGLILLVRLVWGLVAFEQGGDFPVAPVTGGQGG